MCTCGAPPLWHGAYSSIRGILAKCLAALEKWGLWTFRSICRSAKRTHMPQRSDARYGVYRNELETPLSRRYPQVLNVVLRAHELFRGAATGLGA